LLIVVVNGENLGNVKVGGVSTGLLIVNETFALALLKDAGVYPRCFAIDTADDLLTAESKNISLATMLA
jgi:hypothetical protein